jgi:hypothetical protein
MDPAGEVDLRGIIVENFAGKRIFDILDVDFFFWRLRWE